MKIMKFTTMALLMAFIALSYSTAQGFTNLNDCLVTNDIGKFTYRVRNARLGNACGVVGGADHFKMDHVDSICNGKYSNLSEIRGLPLEEAEEKSLSVKVEVTQHTGGDSDRWLLHEVETSFRDSDNLEIGPDEDAMIRTINNNKIFFYGGGVVGYRWINNNVIVNIQYTNLSGPKPEPIEVVKAYLAKFPSTITLADAELKASAHNVQWIKDEMERRLWLCDKWNAQYQAGGVKQADLIYNLVRSMNVFLNYRQKYYGVSAVADLNALFGYKQNNDLTSIQTKLTEYKTWWGKHKGNSISLP
ncbi:MAG: hypothetical protein LLG40_03495 [Deltaproteobacteria bacterium]|nr:hypothetical protein [Deltaproteobacteria bacterium]